MTGEVPAFVCSHVFAGRSPVLLVVRAGGDWQFLCGGAHDDDETPRVVGLNHLMAGDPTLKSVLDLAPECEAERAARDAPWVRRRTV